MARHSAQTGAQVHEDKLIGTALTTDAGKVTTPSAVTNGLGVLRKLAVADLSDTADVATLAAAQTFAGTKTFNGVEINDSDDSHQYVFVVSDLVADRNITLPLLTADDTFVFSAFIQTLTNKTINLTSNTLTGTTAQFNTALSDGDFATLAGTETLTNKRINPRVVALTDAANIAVNSDITDMGTVTLGGNRTLDNPTGTPVDGQILRIRVRQDATAGRTLAYGAQYRFTADVAPVVTATANETSYLVFQYHASDVRWDGILTALDFRTT